MEDSFLCDYMFYQGDLINPLSGEELGRRILLENVSLWKVKMIIIQQTPRNEAWVLGHFIGVFIAGISWLHTYTAPPHTSCSFSSSHAKARWLSPFPGHQSFTTASSEHTQSHHTHASTSIVQDSHVLFHNGDPWTGKSWKPTFGSFYRSSLSMTGSPSTTPHGKDTPIKLGFQKGTKRGFASKWFLCNPLALRDQCWCQNPRRSS